MTAAPARRAALILAAGEGTRMKSALPKVAHRVLGVPMVQLVLETAREAGVERSVVVTGHGADAVEALIANETCVRQERQLGTAHAVLCAEEEFAGFDGSLLVLSGDSPLMRSETLVRLLEAREDNGAAAVLLTARLEDPTGYGRIVRDGSGKVVRIVEQKDLEPGMEALDEVNTGFYCFDARTVFEHLHAIGNANAQGEFYLTDIVEVLLAEGLVVETFTTDEPEETLGVNSRVQLAEAARVLQTRINTAHLLAGVTMTDPALVWISPHVTLGRDVVIEPMSFLMGETVVEDDAVVGPGTRLTDCVVRRGARVDSSVLIEVEVGEGANVGPMTYLRPGTKLAEKAKAGAFVEMKKSRIGKGSKVPHLSYIGDAEVGEDANIGAGTITCNYDGKHKFPTKIGDRAFIGSDTMLVAPVEIGEGAVTGAGSVISRDVPDDSLAIERGDQKNVEGWAAARRERFDREEEKPR